MPVNPAAAPLGELETPQGRECWEAVHTPALSRTWMNWKFAKGIRPAIRKAGATAPFKQVFD